MRGPAHCRRSIHSSWSFMAASHPAPSSACRTLGQRQAGALPRKLTRCQSKYGSEIGCFGTCCGRKPGFSGSDKGLLRPEFWGFPTWQMSIALKVGPLPSRRVAICTGRPWTARLLGGADKRARHSHSPHSSLRIFYWFLFGLVCSSYYFLFI